MSIVLLMICRNNRYKPLVTLGIVAALLVVFPYLDFFRYANGSGYSWSNVTTPTEQLINKPDYDAFQMISNAVASVRKEGMDLGKNLIGSALFFVPRSIWPQKPFGTGQRIGESLEYPNTNLSCPLWAELYYSGGLLCIVLGFWLYGRLSQLLEQRAGAAPNMPSYLILCYAAGFQIFLLRGDLMNAIAYCTPSYLLMGAFLMRGRNRRSSVKSPSYRRKIIASAGIPRPSESPNLV